MREGTLSILTRVSISISDNGLLHISGMKDLKVLEICSGAITDRGVELISRLKGLRTLNLSQNRYAFTLGTVTHSCSRCFFVA
jgi:hypothetical protein